MGGRVAIEVGLLLSGAGRSDRPAEPGACLASRSALALAPARAAPAARPGSAGAAGDHRADRPQPGPGGRDGWSAAGVDEFLRSYLTPRGGSPSTRPPATSTSTSRTERRGCGRVSRACRREALFVWGRQDQLVPIGFRKHVERALPAARHLELDCGHVPQLERPGEAHRAIREFFGERQPDR